MKIKVRKKRPVITPSPKIPAPKRIPGGRPLQPRYEKPEQPEGTAGVESSKPKLEKVPDLSPHWIQRGEPKEEEKPKPNVRNNLLAGLVAGLITFGVLAGVLWSQGFFGGGGGGGGGGSAASYDGTYSANTTTVTPSGTVYGSGTFTVSNGYVSEGNFNGTVSASGHFTGTMANVSPGSPTLTMTGQFSLTSTFTLSGSSGNTSYTISAYKIS